MATTVHLHRLSAGMHQQKSFDMAMNGVGCRASARIMLASTRFYVT
ncbi:IS1-like element transposase [Shigella flexneri]